MDFQATCARAITSSRKTIGQEDLRRDWRSGSLTPDIEEPVPSLTPSSESSEADLQPPPTPSTPTQQGSVSSFLQSCIPLRIECETTRLGRDRSSEKTPLWNVSFGSTTTRGWLFSECAGIEAQSCPSRDTISTNFDFSSAASQRKAQIETPLKALARVPKIPFRSPASHHTTSSKISSAVLPDRVGSEQAYLLDERFTRALPADVLSRLSKILCIV